MLRTVLIWVGLVVVFVVIGTRLQLEGTQVVFAMPLVFLVFFFTMLGRQVGAFKLNNEATTLIAEGRVLEALAVLKKARAGTRNPLPVLNLGIAQLQLWRVADAAATFDQFERRAGGLLNRVPAGLQLASPHASLAFALLGQTDTAKKWIARSPGAPSSKLAGVVLACRAGDFALAARELESHAVLLDQLGGVTRAFAETLAAYVASNTGGRGGSIDPMRMFRESSMDAFKPVWPELHAFIQRATQGPVA